MSTIQRNTEEDIGEKPQAPMQRLASESTGVSQRCHHGNKLISQKLRNSIQWQHSNSRHRVNLVTGMGNRTRALLKMVNHTDLLMGLLF